MVSTDNLMEALEMACSQEFKAIITDIESGHGSGAELLQRIKGERPDIPIAILTCADLSQTEARALGAAKVLRKPVESAVLLDAVRSL